MKKKLNCVLLVDDNDSDNYIHRRVIEQAGITDHIEIAENGQEAIELLAAQGRCGKSESSSSQPDLIFLDINMPVMNGWEFLEEYRKLEEVQKGNVLFIMLITSLNPSDVIKTEKVLGGDSFLYKPLTIKVLEDIMQKHFPEYL
jgi:CheY-like chemotaxis protein